MEVKSNNPVFDQDRAKGNKPSTRQVVVLGLQ